MPLAVMPRIERLDLARVELPADHPAADLGRSVPVHGVPHRAPGRDNSGRHCVQVPLAHHETPVQQGFSPV